MYRVRVVVDDTRKSEIFEECASYSEALSRFTYYVRAALELGCSIWCVNLMNGKKTIKLLSNH